MNHHVKFWIAAFICSCLVTHTFSQSNDDNPEAVVQSYWAAMQAGDWAKCASLIHPDSLARVRNKANGFVDSLLALDKFGDNLRDFFGVSTKDEFVKLSDGLVFERALQRMSLQPGFTEIIKATKHQSLGTVYERDDLVHVLYRADVRLYDSAGNRLKVAEFESHNDLIGVHTKVSLPDPDNDRAGVISLKKQGSAWRLLSGDEVETALSEWRKNFEEFRENLTKFANELSKKNTKTTPAASSISQPQSEERVNINTASIDELQRLPGIGAALASRIVEHRRKHGQFKRPQDIVIVRGMSAKLYRRIAHLIRI